MPIATRPPAARVRSLSLHRGYACAHAGACCAAGWVIPVERPAAAGIRAAMRDGHLRVDGRDDTDAGALLPRPAGLPDAYGAVLGTDRLGRCLFFEPALGNGCAIHRALGEAALPVSCRQFPRVSLIDARGVAVSLSNFCPTAAGLLLRRDRPLAIDTDPPAFPATFPYEGLDARGELPPLLREDALHTPGSYDAWERFAVALLARDDLAPEGALALLGDAADAARQWSSPLGSVDGHLARVTAAWLAASAPTRPRLLAEADVAPALWSEVRDAVPQGVERPDGFTSYGEAWRSLVAPGWARFARPVRSYLATRAFASWVAYQGRGLRTAVAALEAALGLLRVELARACARADRGLDDRRFIEAAGAADHLLVHLADPAALASRLGAAERAPRAWPRSAGFGDRMGADSPEDTDRWPIPTRS